MSFVRASENVRRKADHVHIALHEDVEFHRVTTGLERYAFVHEALPELDLDEVDTSVMLFGRRLSMPLVISSMTGGTEEGGALNRRLAAAAGKFGIAMGVGSQRVALEEPALEETFRVRDVAPDILLFANLGAVQLNNGHGVESCARAIEMIGADALMLHLNPLQESVQHGGNTNFRGVVSRIEAVCHALKTPVVVKEVGHGISARAASLLADAGVSGIDVSGAGGTSWAKVESLREPDPHLAELGSALAEWGIPTAESLIAVRDACPGVTIVASGGIRTGEDIAKCLSLGAAAAGMALPLLRCAAESEEALHEKLAAIKRELRTVMFCTGSRTVDELTGRLRRHATA